MVVLLVLLVPLIVASFQAYISKDNPLAHLSDPKVAAYKIVTRIAQILLLVFLISRAGGGWRRFGLIRPSLHDIWRGPLVYVAALAVEIVCVIAVILLKIPHASSLHLLQHFSPELIPYMVVGIVFEEMFLRVYLITRFQDLGWRAGWSLLASSVLFGIPHLYEGISAVPITFAIGVVLGAAFLWWRSIWPGLIGHWIFDFAVLLLALLVYRHK